MSVLDEIVVKLGDMPEKQRAELTKAAIDDTKDMKWIPNPGPQTDAYFSKADILLYGGEPGGGKSQLCLGLAFNEHQRSLIMRRQYGDLDRLVEDALKIHGSRDGFNGSPPPKLKISDKQIIDFAAAHRVGDEQGQMGKGRDLLCVEKGTLVIMGDRTTKPIESLCPGDMVMTLEGEKPVTRILPVRHDSGVRVTMDKYSQVQSRAHSLLTSSGWVSYDKFCESHLYDSFLPTQHHESYISSWRFVPKFLRYALRHGQKAMGLVQSAIQEKLNFCHQSLLETCAYIFSPVLGSVYVKSCASNPMQLQHSLWNYFAKHVLPQQHKEGSTLNSQLQSSHEVHNEPSLLKPQDYQDGYLFDNDLCGELPQLLTYQGKRLTDDPVCPQQLNDAELRIPNDFEVDDLVKIPKYKSHREWYCHPYTKEIRQIDAEVLYQSCEMTPVGEVELHDIEVQDSNHYITVGGFINKNCFDEATHFAESQIRFVMGWLRTEDPSQRTRVIMATNPPLTAEGLWVIEMFAPWLDPKFINPANPGELRWVISDSEGKDKWVDGPGDYEITVEGKTKFVTAKSRTYIPASVEDNPYYAVTDYKKELDSMPEPYRSLLMGGFRTSFRDQPNQVIPTAWVQLAQERWTSDIPDDVPMCSMGVDCSGGGTDPMVISYRYDGWFGQNVEVAAKDIPMERSGAFCAGQVLMYRRDGADVVVDLGGGYGGPLYEHLKANGISTKGYKGAESTTRRTIDGKLKFTNTRSAAYWSIREALDPGQPGGSPISLPPSPRLLADLTAPTFEVVPNGIKIEPKDDVVARLGRSTNDGDSVVMCWFEGAREKTDALDWIEHRLNHGRPKVVMGRTPLTAR